MEQFTTWFLIYVVSQLLLPLMLVGMLCAIGGIKAEPIVEALLKLYMVVFKTIWRLLPMLIDIAVRVAKLAIRWVKGRWKALRTKLVSTR